MDNQHLLDPHVQIMTMVKQMQLSSVIRVEIYVLIVIDFYIYIEGQECIKDK